MSDRAKPALCVVYGEGAATPTEIWAAAQDVCVPVVLYDSRREHASAATLLGRLPGAVDEAATDDPVAELLAREVRGVVTFAEARVEKAAALAAALGLPGHRPETVEALTNKSSQREALNRLCVPLRYREVRAPSELAEAIEHVGLPAVAKPLHGWGSRGVLGLRDEQDAAALAEEVEQGGYPLPFVLEELATAGGHPSGAEFADYVSVETLAFEGRFEHYLLSDRPRMRPPFREGGLIVPSSLPPPLAEAAKDETACALRAIGATTGVFHTEVKLSKPAPVVIEVNGRLGGGIAPLLSRVSAFNPVQEAMRIALGQPPSRGRADCEAFSFWWVLTTETSCRVSSLPSVESLRAVPGVWSVQMRQRAPAVVDTSLGVDGRLADVMCVAPSVEAMRQALTELDAVGERETAVEPLAEPVESGLLARSGAAS